MLPSVCIPASDIDPTDRLYVRPTEGGDQRGRLRLPFGVHVIDAVLRRASRQSRPKAESNWVSETIIQPIREDTSLKDERQNRDCYCKKGDV